MWLQLGGLPWERRGMMRDGRRWEGKAAERAGLMCASCVMVERGMQQGDACNLPPCSDTSSKHCWQTLTCTSCGGSALYFVSCGWSLATLCSARVVIGATCYACAVSAALLPCLCRTSCLLTLVTSAALCAAMYLGKSALAAALTNSRAVQEQLKQVLPLVVATIIRE